MDFDIGTFIYILLTLVFIIIGSLGKKKKPQPKPQNQETEGQILEEKELDPFTENFKKLFGDFDIPRGEKEEYNTVAEENLDQDEVRLDSPYGKIDNLEGALDVPPGQEGSSRVYKIEDYIKDIMESGQVMKVDRSSSKSTFVSRALRDFDPKKALLYSEIFKPKYF
jgi:hypothetical protein